MPRKSTRDLILNVAATLFANEGFRHTTMETIAAAAGRGRRTVYMYFHDKVEIYNAVVNNEIALITSALRDVLNTNNSFQELLIIYAVTRVDAISKLLRRNPLLTKDFAQSHNRVERLREKLNSEELRLVAPCFREALKNKSYMYYADPADLALTFLNMLRGNDRLLTQADNETKAKELARLSCDIFVKGLNICD